MMLRNDTQIRRKPQHHGQSRIVEVVTRAHQVNSQAKIIFFFLMLWYLNRATKIRNHYQAPFDIPLRLTHIANATKKTIFAEQSRHSNPARQYFQEIWGSDSQTVLPRDFGLRRPYYRKIMSFASERAHSKVTRSNLVPYGSMKSSGL